MKKLSIKNYKFRANQRAFTLIESLVAITVLTVAVAAPLSLASQSLMSAYSSRDQVIAFHLAQESVEAVRAQRDHNLLAILKTGSSIDWLDGLYVELVGDAAKPFMVDSLSVNNNFISCEGSDPSSCEYLLFDPSTGFYGHENGDPSKFKRFVRIIEVPSTNKDEVTVRTEVQWSRGVAGATRSVIVEENIYKWISGITTL